MIIKLLKVKQLDKVENFDFAISELRKLVAIDSGCCKVFEEMELRTLIFVQQKQSIVGYRRFKDVWQLTAQHARVLVERIKLNTKVLYHFANFAVVMLNAGPHASMASASHTARRCQEIVNNDSRYLFRDCGCTEEIREQKLI
ncbi:hypothetical protein EAI_08931 [Harpegnathos saltator]|uniref:Uncharacterized protein n=1 Tax=Harpegnathos saltator TaxID=610380 RepID=E2BYH7_HARSA|nr:hypothetical protein EAI_08931 [Harpegnathos saltator]